MSASQEFSGGSLPGQAGSFDFAALQQALNDPAIKQMAEHIASDPAFQHVSQVLQQSFSSMMTGRTASLPLDQVPTEPSVYMRAMADKFNDPKFLKMAEDIGKSIVESDPSMPVMLETMRHPEYRAKVEEVLESMKQDPELKPMLEELERAGPMAMIRYWHNPEILSKLGLAMGGTFEFPGMEGSDLSVEPSNPGVKSGTLHAAASAGDAAAVKALLAAGAHPDEVDEEGRSALHFACGYGELDCASALIAAGANLNQVDNNSNTAMHYAAGYGQPASAALLVQSGADRSLLNADGKTALEVAQLNEQPDVILALMSGPES